MTMLTRVGDEAGVDMPPPQPIRRPPTETAVALHQVTAGRLNQRHKEGNRKTRREAKALARKGKRQ